MRRIGFLVLALAFGFNILIVLVLVLHKEAARPEGRLPDGNLLRIEKLTYGTNHLFARGSSISGRLRRILPRPLKGIAGSYSLISPTTEKPELLIWYDEIDPITKEPIDWNGRPLQVRDAHGCIFQVTQSASSGTTLKVATAHVPVFPRRQKSFLVETRTGPGGSPTQIEISNPFRVDPHTWKPELLPIRRQSGDLEVICTDIESRSYPSGVRFEPHFQIFDHGQDRTEWFRHFVTFVDETGNRGDKLCPYEPAWKLEVKLFRTYRALFQENEIARMNGIGLPDSGQVIQKDVTTSVGDKKIGFVALCGPGDYKFSNQVCVAAAPWQEGWMESSGSSSSYNGNQRLVELEVRKKKFSLILDLKNLDRYQELLVRVRDKQGKFYPASFNLSSENIYSYEISLPTGLGPIDLEFIPQKPIQVEFMVKPPEKK